MTNIASSRPITTLYMLMSVDGKISTGSTDLLDVDADFPKLPGVREGLHQYYEIEQTTDLWSFCTGRVQAKIGVNEREEPEKTEVSFVLLDNKNLTSNGVRYFCKRAKSFVLITCNPAHPAFSETAENLHIIYQKKLDLRAAFTALHDEYGCERLTIQSGGSVNALLMRDKLIDYIDIVVAPVLVGGRDTPTLIDGESITTPEEFSKLSALRLVSCEALEDSYIRLRYEVIK